MADDLQYKVYLLEGQENFVTETKEYALKKEYPGAYRCAQKISIVFEQHLGKPLSDEEKMYLMLHTNRLCTREQSDQ